VTEVDVAGQSVRGSLVVLVAGVVASALSAISTIVVTRLLTPTTYGLYSLALVVPNVLQLFLGLNIDTGLTREVASVLSRDDVNSAKRLAQSAVL
jgi:O-antigen/teichoic acid export membrane protein